MTRTAAQVRSAQTPNSKRKAAYRYAWAGLPCTTCAFPLDWSRDLDSRATTRGTFGHILAHTSGGTYNIVNVMPQCGACQREQGTRDMTGIVLPPVTSLPAQTATDAWRAAGHDPADLAPREVAGTESERRAEFVRRYGK